MLNYQKLKKMLSNWEDRVVGITVKPSLYQIIVRDYMPNSFPVYPHQYQKEDICIFYDHRSLQQHLRLAEENKGFTVVPQKGFDVTAALKERGEWHEE